MRHKHNQRINELFEILECHRKEDGLIPRTKELNAFREERLMLIQDRWADNLELYGHPLGVRWPNNPIRRRSLAVAMNGTATLLEHHAAN